MRLAILATALLVAACGSTAGGCPAAVPTDTTAAQLGCLRFAVTPDARDYTTGVAKITFTAVATNVSAQACGGPSQLVCGGPPLAVADASGKLVWRYQPPARACPLLIRLLQPGESMSTKVDWPSPGLATGVYSVAGIQTDMGRAYFKVC